jgi:ABC-type lipoprotein export system ATPase subunit
MIEPANLSMPPTTTRRSKDETLSATGLRKTYRLGTVLVPVLKGASIEVRKGEWVAILGASGSGKSTLLHLLGDLDTPDAGSGAILYQGQQLQTMSLYERNRYRNAAVGFVFQFYHLLPELNVVENTMLPDSVRSSLRPNQFWMGIMGAFGVVGGAAGFMLWRWLSIEQFGGWLYGVVAALACAILTATIGLGVWTEIASLTARFSGKHRATAQRATELLQSFGLGHRLNHRPRELSGGERQRVAIARALMNNPQVLLADEPTGNLDEKTGGEILDLIAKQHASGLTIVMVTHDPSIAKRADRIVRLHDGKVVEE